jgi:site-specific DNA recombinase
LALRRQRSDLVRTSQNALLAGLLFCKSCERPMIATDTAKGRRRFRYYVCRAARQNGWDSCSTKSVAAGIE